MVIQTIDDDGDDEHGRDYANSSRQRKMISFDMTLTRMKREKKQENIDLCMIL
jgi:hypothetical protein